MCKHNWKILSETTTESIAEHYKRINDTIVTSDKIAGSSALSKRKFIQILTCNKCGKLERFVEEICSL